MKHFGRILSIAVLMVMLTTSLAFAGTLELVDSYPRDGDGGFQIENTGVKLYFNKNVLSEENKTINEGAIKILNAEGKKMKTQVFYSSKEEGLVLVLIEGMLDTDAEYTLKVTEDFVAADGDTLEAPIDLTFKTRDTSKDMMVNMILMVVMFAGVLIVSTRKMKKQMAEEQAAKAKDDKVNPYRVAKETGKSVKEVVEQDQKEKEKKARQEAKKNAKAQKEGGKDGKKADLDKDPNHYRVKGPKPISLAGSAYKTGRKDKAEAEAARKEAARRSGTTRPKNQSGKAKNKKK